MNWLLVNRIPHSSALMPRLVHLTAFLLVTSTCKDAKRQSGADSRVATDSPVVITTDASPPGAPCPVGASYTIRDTAEWATMIEEGKRAVLRAGTTIVDTVDVLFGVHSVGRDSLVFLPVLAYDVDSAEAANMSAPAAWPTDHVLCIPGGRRQLGELAPHFNAGFSSPSVIDSVIYYWGMKPQGNQGRYRLYAMRFIPRERRVDSLFLREEAPATDFRYFYGPPARQSGAIVFEGGDARAVVDPSTWRVLRVEPRAPAPTPRDTGPAPER